jgi:hypothetical protein
MHAGRPAARLGVGLFGLVLVGSLLSCSAGPDAGLVGEGDRPSESASEGVGGGGGGAEEPEELLPGEATGLPESEDPGDDAAAPPKESADSGNAVAPPPKESEDSVDTAGPDQPTPLEVFQRNCEEGIHEWKEGQVDYPEELAVRLDETLDYNAAIDIREAPLPPGEVIHTGGGSAAKEAVFVKCTVAARLVAIGDALDVEQQSVETTGGWVLHEFAPSGVTEWSWTVTATKPVDQELRLELHPAIISASGTSDLGYSSANQASFTTEVHVEASVLQSTAYWFDANWKLIVTICAAVGAGILGFMAWLRKLRKETNALRGR